MENIPKNKVFNSSARERKINLGGVQVPSLKGDKGDKGDQGIGEKGDKGDPGPGITLAEVKADTDIASAINLKHDPGPKISIGTTPPLNPIVGDLWIDTN